MSHIFLQHLPATYLTILSVVEECTPTEKLTKIVNLTSGSMTFISGVWTLESDPLLRLPEGQ